MFDEKLQARFKALPKALQNAITSVEVEEKLRGLSETHKLHLDQWQSLENEVMLALLGFQPIENLETNLKKEVGLADDAAAALAGDIAETIFQPIREELERELGEPVTEEEGKTEAMGNRQQATARDSDSISPAQEAPSSPVHVPLQTSAQEVIDSLPPRPVEPKATPPAPVPSTPPPAPPTARSVRATLSPAYAPDTKSHERVAIDDDPYREPIV